MKPSEFQKTIQCQFDCLIKYGHPLPTFQQISSAVDGDEYGNVYIVVNMELKGRIREALMQMFLKFEVEVR